MKKRVLILGVASVQMDALLLLKELDCETFACARAADGPGAITADHFDEIDFTDIKKLVEYVKLNNIDLIYSVGSDIAMPVVCYVSELLSLPHFTSSDVARICNNKIMMRTKLGENCKGNVPFQIMRSLEDPIKIHYPFIMKPSDSQGQRGVYLIFSKEDLISHFHEVLGYSRSKEVILEKYISGPEISVNVYLIDSKLKFIETSDRITWDEYTGLVKKHVVPSNVVDDKMKSNIKDVVENACKTIGIKNGPAYFQMKIEKDFPYIIEMSPRLDGCHMWKLLMYYSKLNLLKLTFEHLLYSSYNELNSIVNSDKQGMELEFFCQEPNTVLKQEHFASRSTSIESCFYYRSGDVIRPINGKFEKVGYSINLV